jgi:hypothetical protein
LANGRVGWAILVGGTGSDSAAIERLTRAGWHAVLADPSGPVTPAWHAFGGWSR